MQLGKYNVQPMLLYIPDEQYWLNRWEEGKAHFASQGFNDLINVPGIHAQNFGIIGTHTYELDKPNSGHMVGPKYVGGFLSMYMMYNIANNLPSTHFMMLEDDTRFNENWRGRVEQVMNDIPEDFDFLFIGSCCAMDKNPIQVKGDLYRFAKTKGFPPKYPMGGNCFIVAKKALNHIIATQRDTYAPADISLCLHTFPELNVYAILKRPCEQINNEHLVH